MASKGRILVIGGTGYIDKFVIEASAKAGHPTVALVREPTLSNRAMSQIIDNFKALGANLVTGDLNDHESLLRVIKQVDVVISTVGFAALADQAKIIAAIKEAGNVKRFLPPEFGNDVDRVHAVEPAKSTFGVKAGIRRAVEAAGIPFTYVSSNFFAGYFLPNLSHPRLIMLRVVRFSTFSFDFVVLQHFLRFRAFLFSFVCISVVFFLIWSCIVFFCCFHFAFWICNVDFAFLYFHVV